MEKKKEERCVVSVRSSGAWHSYPCHKKAKGYLKDGRPACGIHLRSERQQEESTAKWQKEAEENKAFTQEVQRFCAQHGIEATPRRSSVGEQYVVVEWSAFQELIEGKSR